MRGVKPAESDRFTDNGADAAAAPSVDEEAAAAALGDGSSDFTCCQCNAICVSAW